MAKKKLKHMHAALFSFVGSRDPFNSPDKSGTDGPLLTLLGEKDFGAVYLFYNNEDYLRRASALNEEIIRRGVSSEVRYVEISVEDPTN